MSRYYTIFAIFLCFFYKSACAYEVSLSDKDFSPSSTYNKNTALFSAYVSNKAYSDDIYDINEYLDLYGFSKISLNEIKKGITDAQFLTAGKKIKINGIDNNLYLISFRGTTPSKVEDVLTDIDSSKRRFTDNYSNVHSGFLSSMESVKYLEDNISIYDYIEKKTSNLADIIRNKKSYFLITGHSLGGAIATLYAADLINRGVDKSNILVYTFGSPAVGDKNFVSKYDGNIFYHRIRNQYDPIPFSAYIDTLIDTGNSFENMKITFLNWYNANLTLVKNILNYELENYPYKHIGYMRVFDNSGNDITNNYENMTIFDSGKILFNIKEHFMDRYISNLEKYASSQFGLEGLKFNWNGNGSIINYNLGEKTGFGLTEDVANVHSDSSGYPVVFFQWQRDSSNGRNLKIYADSDYGYATINYGYWNSNVSNRKTYKHVKLPFVLDPTKDGFSDDNGEFFAIAVLFNRPPVDFTSIRAFATNENGSSANLDLFINRIYMENNYYWSGNGSLISYSSGDKIGYGLTSDVATVEPEIEFPTKKPSVFFQWEIDSSDGKTIKISSANNCFNKVRITKGEWSTRDYDTSVEATLPYSLKETKTDGEWVLIRVDLLSKPTCSDLVRLDIVK